MPTARLLADTCALISFFSNDGRLGPAGDAAMRRSIILVSPISVWEITCKQALGKLPTLPQQPGNTLSHYLSSSGYLAAPLTWEIAERANALPWHHKDPMDRMLIATAMVEQLPIVTNDTIFAQYGVACVW